MAKKVLITGATGLIGKETVDYLLEDGYEIYAISTKENKDNKINWIKCDIFDLGNLKNIFEKIKPQYLLNFAWITTGDYLTNEKNILYKNSSAKMLEYFKINGGKRAVYAGTGFEYKHENKILKETSPLEATNLYEQTKTELRNFCMEYSKKNNLSFAWGRIFYVFGHNEKQIRLTPVVINKLKNNEIFELPVPNNRLDYMYSKDIAGAFVKILNSDYFGDVNISTGEGILLKDYVLLIQELLGKKNLIKFDENKIADKIIVGDNSVLKNVIKFSPKYSTKEALREVIKDFCD